MNHLAGESDRVVPRANAEMIAQEISTVQIVTIEGSHMAMYTNPLAAAAAITHFIQNL